MFGPADILRMLLDSLPVLGGGYIRTAADAFDWPGERPRGHHAHGWFETTRIVLIRGKSRRVRIRKRRWRLPDRSATCHSQPPDAIRSHFDALFVAAELFCYLASAMGLHRYLSVAEPGPSRRTVYRWLQRAVPYGLDIQHAIRFVLIEKSEPRPRDAIRGGLSPPPPDPRRWRDPDRNSTLRRALAMLFAGSKTLNVPTAPLLAEARGRYPPAKLEILP